MKVNYLDKDGKSKPMYMGCYGIGVGRTMASVIEDNHDDYGPIWPMSIAPYQVHIVALQPNGSESGEKAEALYKDLQSKGVEVLFDDRGEKAGFMFSDADLLGVPFRVIVSPKTLANGMVEFRTRASRDSEMIPVEQAADVLAQRVRAELDRYL
jgi:prolyl-tRNA synthetase